MSENNRLDLNGDLKKLSGDLLKDVAAATEEVKQRRASDAEKDRRNATKKSDRRVSVILIAAAVVVLIAISYFVNASSSRQAPVSTNYVAPQKVTRITPRTGTVLPKAPPKPMPRSNNNVQTNPPNEYEQPGQ